MPKLDLDAIEPTNRSSYPMPFKDEMAKRHFQRLGPPGGLEEFGVSRVRLEPGGVSSQRHWHDEVDEFVVVVEGEGVLVEDQGETLLKAGDCAVFPKGVANGHHIVNRSGRDCIFLAVGSKEAGSCFYPDVDLHWDGPKQRYARKDGTPYG
jgi:uncharacterized cupin superfamily protein